MRSKRTREQVPAIWMGKDASVPRVPGLYWSTGEQVGYDEEGYLQFDTWMILNTKKNMLRTLSEILMFLEMLISVTLE